MCMTCLNIFSTQRLLVLEFLNGHVRVWSLLLEVDLVAFYKVPVPVCSLPVSSN